MMTTSKIQPWRRLAGTVQAVIVIGLPFLRINGESALRFDVATLQLHFFGMSLWMEEFFIVLIALIFLSLLVIFITLLLGRIWCGWLCPQTVISDITAFIDKAKNKGIFYKLTAYSVMILVSTVLAANLIWYFVSPYDFFPRLIAGSLGSVVWWFWIVITAIMFFNFLLLRQKFCATVCPYAKLQSTMFDNKTLVVAFDPRRQDECIDCMACVKACPVGIDIRAGSNIACIHCAECVDSCAKVMDPGQKKSLIGYFFGLPGEGGKILRQNVVMFGSVTAGFLLFFLYLLAIRTPVDLTVLPNYSFLPRIVADGGVVNSFVLSVKNMRRNDAEFKVDIKGIEGNIKIVPDRVIHVNAGEIKKIPVYISIKNFDKKILIQDIDIIIKSASTDKFILMETTNFIIPGD